MAANLSQRWFRTLPSITKFWFYSCLTTSIICTLPALSEKIAFIDFLTSILNGSVFALDWPLISSGQIWRIFTPFLVVGGFVPGITMFTLFCLWLIGSYVRELEEHYYGDGSRGAARLTAVLLFGATALLGLSNKLVEIPYLGLPLIFFTITHYASIDPWSSLGSSEVLLNWHLPYLLLCPLAIVATPMVGQALIGILIGYAYFIVTVRVKERFNITLWMTEPSILVRVYQHFGIGQPKIGYQSTQGYSLASDSENES